MRILNVIMVEDSEDDARLLAEELKRAHYQVAAERVETADALQRALSCQPWDLVFCDFTLPRFSGKTALEIVRQYDPDLPFIYVSGTIGQEVAVEAMKAGARDYVMKNNLARLAPAVARELREAPIRREERRAEAERQRLIAELQASLAAARYLSGLLPICWRCQRIRDQHACWQAIENYIQERTSAEFSDGLCPECRERLQEDAESH